MMKKSADLVFAIVLLSGALIVPAHEPVTRARTAVNLPDLPGYLTLKCDFHIHTVFSDGLVWPSVRAEEAWRQGLDALAITDHIEYQPHKNDLSTNHNRSFEIAHGTGADLDILVIRGAEITRQMPPGHLNAIFLADADKLAVETWQEAARAAHEQGAFIFWNHPGWDAQTTNGLVVWYPQHTELLEQGMLHGIEVVNGRDYYPEAHRWALEKKLAMLSNSDIHSPLNLDYHVHAGDHRPLTLVFAEERSLESIKKALFNRQTAVYSANRLVGERRFLEPIFQRSVRLSKPAVTIRGKGRVNLQISNSSDLDYELEAQGGLEELSIPSKLILPAMRTVLLTVQGKSASRDGRLSLALPYQVKNLLVGPGEPLSTTIGLEVTFQPAR